MFPSVKWAYTCFSYYFLHRAAVGSDNKGGQWMEQVRDEKAFTQLTTEMSFFLATLRKWFCSLEIPNILLWSWLCQAKREALNSFLQDDYLPCMGLSWKGRNTKLGTISRREGVDISTDPLMTMHVGAPKIFCTWQIPRQRNVIIVGMIMMGVKMVFFFFFCKWTK